MPCRCGGSLLAAGEGLDEPVQPEPPVAMQPFGMNRPGTR